MVSFSVVAHLINLLDTDTNTTENVQGAQRQSQNSQWFEQVRKVTLSKQLQVLRSPVKTAVCTDNVYGMVVSLSRSGGKGKLLPAADRKFIWTVAICLGKI